MNCKSSCEIAGMDKMTLQPAAGAHGEITGVMLIKHIMRKEETLIEIRL